MTEPEKPQHLRPPDATDADADADAASDYYLENGMFVFTAEYHLRRGICCNSGCRHCPFAPPQPKSANPGDPAV